MKKMILFAAAMALTFASCGQKTQSNSADSDSTASELVEGTAASSDEAATAALSDEEKAQVNEICSDLKSSFEKKDGNAAMAALAKAQTIYKNLVAQGKLEEAKAYGATIKNFVSNNAEALKNLVEGNVTISNIVEGIKNLPTSAETTAEQAKAAADAAADALKNAPAAVRNAAENAANQAAENAKTAAQNKVNEEVNKANQKAAEASNAAKQKAADKINEAKQKAANKVNEASKKPHDAINEAANKTLKDLMK